MVSSTGSGGVVGEGAGWAAESVVERDRGAEGEEACADAGAEAFEGEQVFAGLEDRFDSLSDRREVGPGGGFVLASWPDDRRVQGGGRLFEFAAGVAFVTEHVEVPGSLAALEQGETDIALGCLGRGQQQRPWGAVEREQAVQAEAPEVAAVADAVAVVGGVGELAAAGRLDAAGALHRGRVDQYQVVVEART